MTIPVDRLLDPTAPRRPPERDAEGDDATTPGALGPPELAELWSAYKASGSVELRNRLTVHYTPLARSVADQVLAGVPTHVDRGDVASYAIFGLIDAIGRFDPDGPARFQAYAVRRIRGAIADELRRVDWTPRSVRRKARALERAVEELQSSLCRQPTEAELAGRMDLSLPEYRALRRDVARGTLGVLDDATPQAEGAATVELADHGQDPAQAVERRIAFDALTRALNTVGSRSRTLLTLYYFDNLTLAEIGEVLGVSEGRACQLHGRAVDELRRHLALAA